MSKESRRTPLGEQSGSSRETGSAAATSRKVEIAKKRAELASIISGRGKHKGKIHDLGTADGINLEVKTEEDERKLMNRLEAVKDRVAAIKKIRQNVANRLSSIESDKNEGYLDETGNQAAVDGRSIVNLVMTEETAEQAEEVTTENGKESGHQEEADRRLEDAALLNQRESGHTQVSDNREEDFGSTSSETSAIPLYRRASYQFCRICHECGTEDLFISPCKCRGSLSLVHRWCLERWLAESDTNHCELCGFSYVVFRKPKFNVIWSLILWIWSKAPHTERKMMFYDLMLFFLIGPLIVLLTFYSFQVADTILVQDVMERLMYLIDRMKIQKRRDDFQIFASWVARSLQLSVISLIITFDVGFLSWSIVRLAYHMKKWYRWYRRNCVVILGGYHNTQAVMPSHYESSSNVRRIVF